MNDDLDYDKFFDDDENPQSSKLVVTLVQLLANTAGAKFLAHGYHWNVKGRDFREFHEFFSEIYSDYEGALDLIAENVRKLGSEVPYLLDDISKMSQLEEAPIPGAEVEAMLASLLRVNSGLLNQAKAAFIVADEANEQGIADFLAGRIDSHQKWDWQLSATLGK